MGKNKIRPNNVSINQGTSIKLSTNQVVVENLNYPIFCFKHIHPGHGMSVCDEKEKKQFIEKLFALSQMTWNEIQLAPKHGAGTEKIRVDSLKSKPPKFITDDVEFLLAARFDGKKPFLFHRNKFIAHVIFIDNKFSVYDHG